MPSNRFASIMLALLLSSPLVAYEASAQVAETPTTPDVPIASPQPVDTKPAEAPSVEQRLVMLLSGYEYFPSREDLDTVAPAAEITKLLSGWALDETARPSLRLRSVDALGYYDDAATQALLVKLVSDAPKEGMSRREARTANLLRHHAITSLAKSKRGESAADLADMLRADDLQLTLTAVHALGKHGGSEGRALLKEFAAETSNKVVRREVAKWVR